MDIASISAQVPLDECDEVALITHTDRRVDHTVKPVDGTRVQMRLHRTARGKQSACMSKIIVYEQIYITDCQECRR